MFSLYVEQRGRGRQLIFPFSLGDRDCYTTAAQVTEQSVCRSASLDEGKGPCRFDPCCFCSRCQQVCLFLTGVAGWFWSRMKFLAVNNELLTIISALNRAQRVYLDERQLLLATYYLDSIILFFSLNCAVLTFFALTAKL